MRRKKESLFWKVSVLDDNGRSSVDSYIFGTMHSASPQAWAHADIIKPHILKTSHYFGETNEEGLSPQSTIWNLPSEWKGVRKLVGNKRFEKVDKILTRQYNLHLERLDTIPPLMISAIISESILCHETARGKILDQELWQFAKKSGLHVDGIESAHEQFEIYKKISFQYQSQQLKKMLLNLTSSKRNLLKLATAYQKNDLKSLFRLSKKSLGEVRRNLLYDRNKLMANRIAQILTNQEPNFVAIGAAHLHGSKGIIRYLKSAGVKAAPIPV